MADGQGLFLQGNIALGLDEIALYVNLGLDGGNEVLNCFPPLEVIGCGNIVRIQVVEEVSECRRAEMSSAMAGTIGVVDGE